MKSIVQMIIILVCIPSVSLAQPDRVTVIPLNSVKKLMNVITVSAEGGDFADPAAALASISGASAADPFLVLIGPGVYTVTKTLVMQPWVTIAGSGREITILTGAVSTVSPYADSAVVSGADNAVLRDLTVINTGGGEYATAVYNGGCDPIIEDVTAAASGGTKNYGIFNHSESFTAISRPRLTGVSASASGGNESMGVYNWNSSPAMTDVDAAGSGATGRNYGVLNHTSSPAMTRVTAAASDGGANNYGVHNVTSSPAMTDVTATASGASATNSGVRNEDYADPVMNRVTASATGGTGSYGVYNTGSSDPVIRQCTLSGAAEGIHVDSGTTRIVRSAIAGAASRVGGTLTCVHAVSGTGAELGPDCQPL